MRPDGRYGASKAYAEALGRMYADRFCLEVISVRIGSFAERPVEPRHLSTWLSGGAVRLLRTCLTAPESDLPSSTAPRRTRAWWGLSSARALGYEPQDNAEDYVREVGGGPVAERQGGPTTAPDHGGWA